MPKAPVGAQPKRREPEADRTTAAPRRTFARSEPRYVERVIDPNRVLREAKRELRSLAGAGVNFALKLDPDLGFAAAQKVPLKAIVRSLVMSARDAMPGGGDLVIETANLDMTAVEPGLMPSMAPNRYVTISFRDSGREHDADALARLFDPSPAEADRASGDGRLPLATVYRVLQICGGDLSVGVESGCGSTLTVFLPRAHEQRRAIRPAIPPFPPTMPSATAH